MRMITLDSRVPCALLAVLLLWAPLPFGSVTSKSEAFLQVGIGLVLLLACLTSHVGSARAVAVPALALLAVAGLGVAQAARWPRVVVSSVSPAHLERQAEAATLLGDPGPTASLSVAPAASRSAALTWSAAAVALLAGAALGRERSGRRMLAGAIVAGGLFQVLYGAQRWFSKSKDIWGVDIPAHHDRLRGTFVNPNHFAVYLGIALAIVFAWWWRAVQLARAEEEPSKRVLLVAPPLIVWLALFASLAFSNSRSGLLAALVGVAMQGFLIAAARRRWRWAPVGILMALLALAVVAGLGLRQGFGRVLETSSLDVSGHARFDAWRAALRLWRDFPALGTGLGTFREAFPLVQPAALPGTWNHAHSDPVELLMTGGVVAAVLVAAGLAFLTRRLAAVLMHAPRTEERAAPLAALGALVTCAIHGLFDFGITLPAIAFTLAVVCGAGAAPASTPHAAGAAARTAP